jgi:hypothetical protein
MEYKIRNIISFWKRFGPPSKRKTISRENDLIKNKQQFNLNLANIKGKNKFSMITKSITQEFCRFRIARKMKEKLKTLNFDTTYTKLKFLCKSKKSKRYEIFNIVTDNGDSIYYPTLEELATVRGQILISEDKIEEIVNKIIDQRLRSDY